MPEKKVGTITHYYGRIGVAVAKLTGILRVGDTIHIKGGSSDFQQVVSSIQIEHASVPKATAGQDVGLKVEEPVREGAIVYLVEG